MRLYASVGMLMCVGAVMSDACASGPDLALHKSDTTTSVYAPLETVRVDVGTLTGARSLSVRDALGREYVSAALAKGVATFEVRGALGYHTVSLLDSSGRACAQQRITVDTRTSITTGTRRYDEEFQKLQQEVGWGRHVVVDGRDMVQHVSWLRDNYYAVKASKYWDTEITGFPQLFLTYQRADGMVYDLLSRGTANDPFTGKPAKVNMRSTLWGPQWVGWTRDSARSFERMPVEADVEYLAVMHTYLSWQATGDDVWMERALPRLERALGYAMSDSLRWSPAHKLLKRAYSIDSWDYIWDEVAKVHPDGNKNLLGGFDACYIDGRTPMGILHADNTGMFEACRQMAKMYRHARDTVRGTHWDAVADTFRVRTMNTCWNGTFFTHYVHIDSFPVDTSVHERDMLSYSNGHAINRGITTQPQAASVLREYQRRLKANSSRAFAEWYTIDPPFPAGFGPVGEYMNGGISPIVAAELMKAAFDNGFEAYGADILKRVTDVHSRHSRLNAVYKPLPPSRTWEKETFTPVNLRSAVNRHFSADKPKGGIGQGRNDLRSLPLGKQVFGGKQFDIIDPAANKGLGMIVLNAADDKEGTDSVKVSGIGRQAMSLYFLHCVSNGETRRAAAYYRVDYTDSTSEMIEVLPGRNIGSWWEGSDAENWKVAWRGANPVTNTLTIGISGWNNPHPAKPISSITFMSAGKGTAIVPAVTLSSARVQLDDNDVSSGIPDVWASANMYWAVAEGLAGVTDNGAQFRDVTVAPRWDAIGETSARVCLRYGPSSGYFMYDYAYSKAARTVTIRTTGTGDTFRFHVLLPAGMTATKVTSEGAAVAFKPVTVEKSPYVDFDLARPCGGTVVITMKAAK